MTCLASVLKTAVTISTKFAKKKVLIPFFIEAPVLRVCCTLPEICKDVCKPIIVL